MPTLSITKTYSDGNTLTEAMLDNIKNDVESFLNSTKIDYNNIQAGGVATGSIADLAITTTKLDALAVTAAKLAADAVITAKILDANVTTAKIADKAITSVKLSQTVTTVTDNYTALTSDGYIRVNVSADKTISLPAVSGNSGLAYDIKHVGSAGVVTIDANSSETIDGNLTFVLNVPNDSVRLVCNGTSWEVEACTLHGLTRAYQTATSAGSTGAWTNFISISLSPGTWDVSAVTNWDANGGSVSSASLAVSQYSGATTTDHVAADNVIIDNNPATNYNRSMLVGPFPFVLTATTTVYAKGNVSYTTATPKHTTRISARRIA
jgi:hypothetical protein